MLGFDDVLNSRPEAFTALADQWDNLAEKVADTGGEWQSQVHNGLGAAAWSGPASQAAGDAAAGLNTDLSGHESGLRQVSGWLRQAGANFADAKSRLVQAQQQAAQLGLVIDNNSVRAMGGQAAPANPPATQASAQLLAREVSGALQQANDADQRAASALDTLAPKPMAAEVAAATGTKPASATESVPASQAIAPNGTTPPGAPAPGADPAKVKQWWDGLSQSQKQAMADKYPYYVGSTNGIPSAARDYANRAVLKDEIRTTTDQEKRKGLQKLQNELQPDPSFPGKDIPDPGDPKHPPKLLLGVDTEGTGHMIVATGNPDSAHNVVTWVPGMGTKLDETNAGYATGIPGNIYNSTVGKNGGQSTSVIAWMDYDAPANPVGAGLSDSAKHAAPDLVQFERGLNATHTPGDMHNVMLGHSYGSTVVGETAKAVGGLGKLGVDDVIAIGSPGMDVGSAKDLGVPPDHVFAAKAQWDYIGVADDFAPVHGTDPTSPAFGAKVFDAGDGGGVGTVLDPGAAHGSYFNSKEALGNMSDIISGNYGDVTTRPWYQIPVF